MINWLYIHTVYIKVSDQQSLRSYHGPQQSLKSYRWARKSPQTRFCDKTAYHCPIWQYLLLSKAENLTPKKRVNRDKPDFATKQRMFGLLTIDKGPPLSMTAGPAVPQLLLVCQHTHYHTHGTISINKTHSTAENWEPMASQKCIKRYYLYHY